MTEDNTPNIPDVDQPDAVMPPPPAGGRAYTPPQLTDHGTTPPPYVDVSQFQTPAQAPAKKGLPTWVKVLGGLFLLMVVTMGGCVALVGSAASNIQEEREEQSEALLRGISVGCTVNQFSVDVQGSITNPTDKTLDGSVQVTLLNAEGVNLNTAYTSFQNLEPGQTAIIDSITTLPDGQVLDRCEVSEVDAWSFGNDQ